MTSHRRSDEDFAMTTKLLPARHAAHRPAADVDDVGAGRSNPPTPPDDRRRLERIWRSPADQPRWARPALLGLLALTAVLYLWDLSASGYANSFYAAAVQAGTKSWKAFFFGSLDAGNSITVDKPPASLWVMELSGRIFGFNSWSLLAPQALEGVAAVGLLYSAVRRVASSTAGLAAGAALALTPAAVLMFRFDNPDALLVLCLVTGAYAVTRALADGRTRWLILAGSVIGLAFLTKMLQGFLVLPAFALTYLLAGPVPLRRRIGQVLAGAAAVVAAAGWWVLIVTLWPASDRPYVGGSTNDSILELVFGYNGLGRIFGGSGNGGGGAGGVSGSSFGGATGLSRLFSSEMGNEISWLLPAALVGFVALLWFTRRAPRTDRLRAATLLWGGWLLVTGLVFSYMQGTIHPYYTVALAPAIAALVALAAHAAWERRATVTGRLTCVALVLAAGLWSFVLLGRTSSWQPELRWLVLVLTLVAGIGLAVPIRPRLAVRGLLAGGLAAALIGTTAFGVATAASPHTGSIPSVGPAAAASAGGGPGTGGGLPSGRTGGAGSAAGSASRGGTGTSAPGSAAKAGSATSGSAPSGSAPSGSAPSGSAPTGSAPGGSAKSGSMPTGSRPAGGTTSGSSGPDGAAKSGVPSGGGGATTSTALTNALKATSSKWAAAVVGDQSAATLELATGKAVISIGGWSGTDPSPTLAQFEHYVVTGQVRYLITSGGMASGMASGMAMGGGSAGVAAQITKWVAAHYKKITIGGQTVYDLSQPLT
jgi:4-amino-4-deoxy-L-arabinose transferase-like glycosyltransferase